ncbi:hypothetical protein DL96DRAFT_1627324 [Flagelloscypha sp. PMI_526]|nr:hypothetical protein DL96DRAFT_1627324 [Flagelloscypha sp. PMI_526]
MSSSVAVVVDPLPIELVFHILDYALKIHPAPSSKLKFLLLSRPIYDWMLPRLYNTLDLKPALLTPRPSPLPSDRTLLHSSTPRSSLLYTRRLISRLCAVPFPFAPFSNLSHLSLWGRHHLHNETHGPSQAREIVMLPLEELVVWESTDNEALLKCLSDKSTIWKTLERLCCYTRAGVLAPHEGWMHCPNLAQVFVLCDALFTFIRNVGPTISLPSLEFRSFIISPLSRFRNNQISALQDALGHIRRRDRRIMVLYHPPDHLFSYPQSFWVNQGNVWMFALEQIEKNVDGPVSLSPFHMLRCTAFNGLDGPRPYYRHYTYGG